MPFTAIPAARERWYLAITLALAALGFVVALQHMSHSIWRDEGQTVDIATQATPLTVVSTAMRERPYPPLFFLVDHYSLRWRGDEVGLRLPSAFFGALAVIAVFLLGRLLEDAFTGMLASLFFVLTPGVFRYFVDGNPYTLLALVFTLSTFFLVRALRSGRVWDWIGYALLVLAGLATHALFVFYLFAQILAGLYLLSSVRPRERATGRRFFATASLLVLAEMLWIAYYSSHGGMHQAFQWSGLLTGKTAVALAAMYAGPLSMGYRLQLAFWGVLQLLGAAALFLHRRTTLGFLVALAAPALILITLFVKGTVGYVAYKYGLGIFPLACIVAACAPRLFLVETLAGARARFALRQCVLVLAAVFCLSGGAFLVMAGQAAFEYQNWKGVSQYLKTHAQSGDTVISSGILTLGYYYHGPAKLERVEPRTMRYDRIVDLLHGTAPEGRKVWIAISSFQNENPLVASFTESGREPLEERTKEVVAQLRARGMSAETAARFHRIRLIVVSPKPKPVSTSRAHEDLATKAAGVHPTRARDHLFV